MNKMLSSDRRVVVYDTDELDEYLKQRASESLLPAAKEKISGLKPLFTRGVLFHYRFHGDYSAERIAHVLLQQAKSGLDPSLLGMAWQRKLFERSPVTDDLKKETEKFLIKNAEFDALLVNYLNNKTKNIY